MTSRSSFGRVMASGPDRGLARSGLRMRPRGDHAGYAAARNSKRDTLLTSVTDEVFPILIGNVWQSATQSFLRHFKSLI